MRFVGNLITLFGCLSIILHRRLQTNFPAAQTQWGLKFYLREGTTSANSYAFKALWMRTSNSSPSHKPCCYHCVPFEKSMYYDIPTVVARCKGSILINLLLLK